MDAEKKNFLGIDWGASAVGVAFADGETRMAFPLPTLQNNRMLLRVLGDIVSGKDVGMVVIGMPSHVNRMEVGRESERLGVLLEKHFPVKVVYQDEMFTTKMAEANLKERGARNISRFDDAEAARIILQEWLDKA
jgi:putative transcription antitermination factor YqgF